MIRFVLDISVALKWFSVSGENDLDHALELRQKMLEGSVLFIEPELLLYDAYFLTLSHMEEIPLVTADYRFVERMKGVKGIIKLSDIDECPQQRDPPML